MGCRFREDASMNQIHVFTQLRGRCSGQTLSPKSVLLGATLALCWTASAYADQIFLKVPGINGTVTATSHAGEIFLTGFRTNGGRGRGAMGGGGAGAGGGGGAGAPVCGQVTLAKPIDKTSPLFLAFLF